MRRVEWRVGRVALAVLAGACLAVATRAADDTTSNHNPLELTTPLVPPTAGVTGAGIFENLVEHSKLRDAALKQYSLTRTYKVSNDQGKAYATEVVKVEFHAPSQKVFSIVSEEGSWLVRELVLKKLIESEEETSKGKEHKDSSISPANYNFTLLGEQEVGAYHCYVMQAEPKHDDKYLFKGKVWISAADFGIVRIAGQPAKKLSFWITRADFVRQYQKFDEFWLPSADTTYVQMRVSGKKVLSIVHENYVINGGASASAQAAGGNSSH